MRAAPHPENPKRLQALCSFNIIGSESEAGYDDIVELAAGICDVPVALISLVETDRQWFKARIGMDLPETPIEQSVCSHAILSKELTEIHDTSRDPRTVNNPLLHGEDPLLFYAGAPLLTKDGMPLGTLCVLDTKPRTLTLFQRKALVTLAAQVVKQMELRRALQNEETLRSEMDHRIKNSLQATSSLVRIYTRAVEDDAAREALIAVQRRIDGMSALHEQLQKSSASGRVDMVRYLNDLIDSLRETIPPSITVHHTADAIDLPSNYATDLGIIVSEFVANTIKHGFPNGAAGEIQITLTSSDDNKLVLQASDNGLGSAAPPPEISRISGIGSSLLAAAASNLGGTLTNDLTDNGAHLTLVFPPR